MRLPDGYSNLFPYLMVEDAPACLAFLAAVFGATERGRTLRDGRVANAEVVIGSVGFMVAEAQPGMGVVTGAHYLFVDDADAVHARALAHGATELYPPTDMPYDDRQSGVRDPFGTIWFISTRLVDGPYH